MKECTNCGTIVGDDVVYCPKCGNNLNRPRYCTFCGKELLSKGPFCPNCGNTISPTNMDTFSSIATKNVVTLGDKLSEGKKSKIVAILLAFFLGCIGGQYFYLAKYFKAVLCILFCWTCFPALWGMIHAIILLAMSDCEFDSKYN